MEKISGTSFIKYKFITTLQLCLASSLTTVKNVSCATVNIKTTVNLAVVMNDKNLVK